MVSIIDRRADFPALHQQVNGHRLTYLDNAATTQRPRRVIEALRRFDETSNANVHRGVHALSQQASDLFDEARARVRRFIHARDEREIIFTKGCTEAINLVAYAWGRANLRPGDRVLASTMEHHSNLVPWQLACEAAGASIEPIPVDDACTLDLEAFEAMLDERVKLVAVKHVCNASGTINPVAEIARLAHAVGAKVMVDGAQALAHAPVDVQALGVDFYAMAAHKVYGPTGVGALYGRRELLEAMPPFQSGGGMIRLVSFEKTTFAELPDRFEAGTPPIAAAIGFGEALAYLSEVGIDAALEVEEPLVRQAMARLSDIPGVRLIGTSPMKTAVVSFVMDSAHAHDVGTILDQHGVAIRTGHHCCQPLMRRLGVPATARASFALYNTQEDVDALIGAVQRVQEIFG